MGPRIDNDNRPPLGWGDRGGAKQIVKIEAINKTTGLNGGREVWFHVFSNEVMDWPSVEAQLDDGQRAILENLGKRTLAYFPHDPTSEEREEHGYLCDDWWVWSAVRKGK